MLLKPWELTFWIGAGKGFPMGKLCFPNHCCGKHAENIAPVHRITPFPTGTVCFPFPTLSFKWESHAFETLGNSPEQYLGKPVHAFETLGNSPEQYLGKPVHAFETLGNSPTSNPWESVPWFEKHGNQSHSKKRGK
jgi:hypothetical protein